MTQNRTDWAQLTRDLEADLRAGKSNHVRKTLMASEIAKAPRRHVIHLSNLARRAQLPALSLRLLRPYIHPAVKNHDPATPEERLEYAYALQRIGAKNEAVGILEQLLNKIDHTYLAFAFHHLSEWNYASALEYLERFLASPKISPYDRSVGEVNRLACLVALADPRAEELFAQLRVDLRAQNFFLLSANILEIMAQYWIHARNFANARELLGEAENLAHGTSDIYRLFIKKWSVVADALETRNAEGLDQLRRQALEASHWETLRDLDYFRSVLNPQDHWASWVYFGTPYPSFRARLEKLRPFPETEWVCRQQNGTHFWDPWFAKSSEGELQHRFVAFLARDFYRPARIGEIFSALFPEQYFDIDSSPGRIHQIARRGRQWIEEESLPLKIEGVDGAYRLQRPASLNLLGRKSFVRFTKTEFMFDRFRGREPQAMTLEEWSQKIGMNATKTRRLLQEAKTSGLIEVAKHGQYTHYVLKP